MRAQQSAVKGDLDGVADEADAHGLTDEAVADAIIGAGEADRPVLVDAAQHLGAFGGRCRPTRVLGSPIHPVVIDQMPPSVCGDHDTVMRDVEQAVCGFDRDRLAG